jgi:hypothetical protein
MRSEASVGFGWAVVAAAVVFAGCGSEPVPPEPDAYVPVDASVTDGAVDDARPPGDTTTPPADGSSTTEARMIGWEINLTDIPGPAGTSLMLRCGPGDLRVVFGTRVYAAPSSICSAAFHSELITLQGGTFRMVIEPEQDGFVGSLRNGVMSGRWITRERGFSFPEARAPGG